MEAVDTNVLVRLLVGDDADQAERARRVVDDARAREQLFIPTVALVELDWVLRSRYKVPKDRRVTVLRDIATASGVQLDEALVLSALDRYEQDRIDFGDAVNLEESRRVGCLRFWTFDEEIVATRRKQPAVRRP